MTKDNTGSGRRSPAPAERQRDPERTRQRIREAALTEFAAKGFAGARVAGIADRAGVNRQLISYYFGGKEGLYKDLTARWQETEEGFAGPDVPLDELVEGYVRANVRNHDLGKLLLWEGLTGEGTNAPELTAEMRRNVEDLRRRQSLGEFPADLDPSYLLLALFSATAASVAFPHMVRAICGEDPASDEFTDHYAEQVGRLLRHLRDRQEQAPPPRPRPEE